VLPSLFIVVFGGIIFFLLWGLVLNKKSPSPTTAANPPEPVVAADGSDFAVEISAGKHHHQDHPGHSGWFDGASAHGGGTHGGFAGGSHH